MSAPFIISPFPRTAFIKPVLFQAAHIFRSMKESSRRAWQEHLQWRAEFLQELYIFKLGEVDWRKIFELGLQRAPFLIFTKSAKNVRLDADDISKFSKEQLFSARAQSPCLTQLRLRRFHGMFCSDQFSYVWLHYIAQGIRLDHINTVGAMNILNNWHLAQGGFT